MVSMELQEVLNRCESEPVWVGLILLCRLPRAEEVKYQNKMDELIDRYEHPTDYLPDSDYAEYYGHRTWLQDLDAHIIQEEAKADLIEFIEDIVKAQDVA